MNSNAETFDVLVIGGGPAGSTAASFIAEQGWRVLLLERDTFPRHQIGESLLPATVHGVCKLLGVTDELAKLGFPKKRGGTLRWGKSPEPWTFRFARNSDAPGGYAYQVERSIFDNMLLRNAEKKGVIVRENCSAREIIYDGERAVGARYTSDNFSGVAYAAFVVDAGGNGARQYNNLLGQRIYSKLFQNIALYGYYEGGKRLPYPNEGNILSCAFSDGWFWYIPLSSRLTSVGVVFARERADLLRDGYDVAFARLVDKCTYVKDFLSDARRVTVGQYGKFRVRSDYSYCNTKFWSPGLVLIGDSACFVDPIFSSGVHLATYSALLAARSINTCLLDRSLPEAPYLQEFEMRYRREYGNFYQFCSAFYDMDQDTDSYFWVARKILNTEEWGNEAFVRLVAGVSQQDDPIFSAADFFKARIGLGVWFEDTIARDRRGGLPPMYKFDTRKFDPSNFMLGFTREIIDVQLLALYGDKRPTDQPLVGNGLIPSADGFHWRKPSAPKQKV